MNRTAARQVVIVMIQSEPPPRPACFPGDLVWREWLLAAHLTGLRVSRVVDVGKWSGTRTTERRLLSTEQIPYCDGCTAGHRKAMELQRRCYPSKAVVTTKE